jgi:hypothetical protein
MLNTKISVVLYFRTPHHTQVLDAYTEDVAVRLSLLLMFVWFMLFMLMLVMLMVMLMMLMMLTSRMMILSIFNTKSNVVLYFRTPPHQTHALDAYTDSAQGLCTGILQLFH